MHFIQRWLPSDRGRNSDDRQRRSCQDDPYYPNNWHPHLLNLIVCSITTYPFSIGLWSSCDGRAMTASAWRSFVCERSTLRHFRSLIALLMDEGLNEVIGFCTGGISNDSSSAALSKVQKRDDPRLRDGQHLRG